MGKRGSKNNTLPAYMWKEKEVKKVEKDENKEILKRLVSKRFWKWKRVFGKKESERMPVQKT